MTIQPTTPENLGFVPVDPESVFSLCPKLKDMCSDLSTMDIHFKNPTNLTINPSETQQVFQGTMVVPHSNELIDFELASDFLMINSSLLTMPRVEDAKVWGDAASPPEFSEHSTPDSVKNGLITAFSNSPQVQNINTSSIDRPQNALNDAIKRTVDNATLMQPKPCTPPQDAIDRNNGLYIRP